MTKKIQKISCLEIDTKYNIQPIKNWLTRVVEEYQTSVRSVSKYYSVEENKLLIPRYFPIQDFLDNTEIVDKSHVGEDIQIVSHICLRNQLQKDTARNMLSHDSGIIQLSPGSGKTIISIYVICQRKKKTLILVHRKSLVDQWIERFLQFTNLKKEDIEIFKSAQIKKSFAKPIIIATVQSMLSCITRNPSSKKTIQNSNIGICILDEAHTTSGARKFAQVSLYIPSKVNFGLSATPFRRESGDIMQYHLGKIYHPDGESGTMDVDVKIVLFDFGITRKSGEKNRYFYWHGKFQNARYLTQMKKSNILIETSKKFLSKALQKGRDILFISKRLSIIDILYDAIDSNDKAKFIAGSGNDSLLKKLVFSTPGKIRDGVDCPSKDFLLMTSPVNNIEQLTGRVVRYLHGKKKPIVIDFVDIGCKEISRTVKKRINFYKSKGWNISYFSINNDKISVTNEKILGIYI